MTKLHEANRILGQAIVDAVKKQREDVANQSRVAVRLRQRFDETEKLPVSTRVAIAKLARVPDIETATITVTPRCCPWHSQA